MQNYNNHNSKDFCNYTMLIIDFISPYLETELRVLAESRYIAFAPTAQKPSHAVSTEGVYWHADCCLAKNYELS
jgi:hypothetical protein